MIGPGDKGYEDLPRWKFSVAGYAVTWMSAPPYLYIESDQSRKIVEQISKFIEQERSLYGDKMSPGVTGIEVPTDISSPYMVLYAVSFIYDKDDGLKFSKNAPTFFPETDPGYGEERVIN